MQANPPRAHRERAFLVGGIPAAGTDARRGVPIPLVPCAFPPHPVGRCFEACPDVLREAEEANHLRALLARMLERLPPSDPLVEEARRCLE